MCFGVVACTQSRVEDGRRLRQLPTSDPTNAVCWNPCSYVLAYVSDDKSSIPDHDKGLINVLSVV